MTQISLINASKDFGVQTLFRNLIIHINEKERLGLIGPNGSGKSTLLKIFSGIETLDKGERKCSPKLRIQLVNQDIVFKSNRTVIEEVLAGCGEKRELLLRFNKVTQAIGKEPKDNFLLAELGQLSEQMDNAQAWGLEQQCKEILGRLGISDVSRSIHELSGGYQKRVGLASALVANPDVLLLDEPTNHLDASAVEWLQSWLEKFEGSLILVTHDRYVLDRVTNRMIEVNNGHAQNYSGNYTSFLEQKMIQESSESSSYKKFKGVLRRELEWLKQGPKARSTKQKARLKRIKEMQAANLQKERKSLEISTFNRRIGKLIIDLENIELRTNQCNIESILLKDFSYSFNQEDRVGIIGPNGCGKSTLLDIIAGKRQPYSGKIRKGDTVHLGYLDQHTDIFRSGKGINRKVIEFIEEEASTINLGKEQVSATQLLERFLFPPAQQHSPIGKLSGGERRRLTLCRMLIKAPNVLLLDEPTNDLDINTLSILEEFIEDFHGCVIVISHDRYFLDRTVDRILSFEEATLTQFEGNYTSYLEKKDLKENRQKGIPLTGKTSGESKLNEKINVEALSLSKPKSLKSRSKKKLSFKENKELEDIEKELPYLEKERAELETEINNDDGDLVLLSNQLADLTEKIHQVEERWLELSELQH